MSKCGQYLKTNFNNNSLKTLKKMKNQITPTLVEGLYNKLDNKQLFLSVFGTKKFYLVDQSFLERMYNYLIRKIK